MQSDIAKSDVKESDLRIGWPTSSDDSAHRTIKSKNGIGPKSSKKLTEQSLVYTAAVRGIHRNTSSDALDYEYNHDARTQ